MGDKHPKKTPGTRHENGHGAAPDGGPPQLRAQIAALAEQVRRLSIHEQAPIAAAATPAALVGDVEALPPPVAPLDAHAALLAVEVIAMAERAADQIRARAEREAERIRAERGLPTAEAELLGILRRQRAALAVLAGENERLGQSAEIIRGQLRVLEGELAAVHEFLGTPQRPPVGRRFNVPAA
jgi:hypothetical protein